METERRFGFISYLGNLLDRSIGIQKEYIGEGMHRSRFNFKSHLFPASTRLMLARERKIFLNPETSKQIIDEFKPKIYGAAIFDTTSTLLLYCLLTPIVGSFAKVVLNGIVQFSGDAIESTKIGK